MHSSSAATDDAQTVPNPPHARVLIFTTGFPPDVGGGGMVPEAIAMAFPDRVAIVTPMQADSAVFDARYPFKVFRVPKLFDFLRLPNGKIRGGLNLIYNSLWIRPRAWRAIRRLLASHPFDIVCLNTVGSTYWLPRLLRRLNPRLKVIGYSHGEEWGCIKTYDLGRRMFRAYTQADCIVAVSSFTVGRMVEEGIPAERIRLVNNGVDPARFSPGPPSPELLDKLGIAGRPNILCLARLDRRKGQDRLIRAMPAILERIPAAVLLIAGSGPEEARLRALVDELGLQSSVLFLGHVSDEARLAWYRTADLYAMPNRTLNDGDTEGFGLVFLEAGACGLAVIGGRAGGVPDAILDGETGLLVDGESVPEVAAACIRLLLGPELRAAMGRNGIAHAARMSWPIQAAAFLSICDSLVDSPRPSPIVAEAALK